jgi:hypothetical protein
MERQPKITSVDIDEKNIRSEETLSLEDTQGKKQIDSIWLRIQNLRKNLQST